MRSKEYAHDYRYFPEPDLLPVRVSAAWKAEIERAMPELPGAKRARFIRDYGITPYDAGVLTDTRALADYTPASYGVMPDRKSTRLNSSHGSISYAVFCLKK